MENIKYIQNSGSCYVIFRDGRVLSLSHGRWGKRKFLRPSIGNHGYPVLNIIISGKKQPRLLHRLLAESFIPNLLNKKEINHIDGNKKNFSLSNLEWVTSSENSIHAFNTGLYKGSNLGLKGVLCKKSRPVLQISISGELVKEWDSQMTISRDLKIKQPSISYAIATKRIFNNHFWEFKT